MKSTRETVELFAEVTKEGDLITRFPTWGGGGVTPPIVGDDMYILTKQTVDQKKVEKLKIDSYTSAKVGDKHFEKLLVQHPSSMSKTYYFLPRIVDGEVDLYIHRYFINGIYPKKRYYLVKNWTTTDVNKTDFREDMAEYFQRNKELSMAIMKKKYKIDDMEEIVRLYNQGSK